MKKHIKCGNLDDICGKEIIQINTVCFYKMFKVTELVWTGTVHIIFPPSKKNG